MIPELTLIKSLVRIIIPGLIVSLSPTFPSLPASFAQTSIPSKGTPQKSEAKQAKVSSTKKQTATKSGTNQKKGRTKKHATRSRTKKDRVRGQREIEPSRIVEIQNALAAAGYYKDQPSGKWDAATSRAMSAYQEANGFKKTGKPDALSLKKLGL